MSLFSSPCLWTSFNDMCSQSYYKHFATAVLLFTRLDVLYWTYISAIKPHLGTKLHWAKCFQTENIQFVWRLTLPMRLVCQVRVAEWASLALNYSFHSTHRRYIISILVAYSRHNEMLSVLHVLCKKRDAQLFSHYGA